MYILGKNAIGWYICFQHANANNQWLSREGRWRCTEMKIHWDNPADLIIEFRKQEPHATLTVGMVYNEVEEIFPCYLDN